MPDVKIFFANLNNKGSIRKLLKNMAKFSQLVIKLLYLPEMPEHALN